MSTRVFAAFLIGVIMFMAGWYTGAGDTQRAEAALVHTLQSEHDALNKLLESQLQQVQEQQGRLKCERERTQEMLEHQKWIHEQTEWMRSLGRSVQDVP